MFDNCGIISAMKQTIVTYLQKNQVISAVLLVLLLWFLLTIRDIAIIVFISFILMASFHPIVEWLAKHKIPRIVSVFLVYILVLGVLILLIFPLIPFFSQQIQALVKVFPIYVQHSGQLLGLKIDANFIKSYTSSHIQAIGSNALFVTSKFFGSLLSVLSTIVISFYLLMSHNSIKKDFLGLFPKQKRKHAEKTLELIEVKLGAWLRGQITLSLTIGILAFIALTLLHIPFALPLALLTGLFEIIPTIGPILAAVPALIVGFSISPFTAILVGGSYIIIQLLESNLIAPKIMESAVGLNPVIVIISVLIGAQLMGIIGALLSIPFVSFLIIIIKNL